MYYSFIEDIKCLNIYKKVLHQSSTFSFCLWAWSSPFKKCTPRLHLTHGIHQDAPAFGPLKQQGLILLHLAGSRKWVWVENPTWLALPVQLAQTPWWCDTPAAESQAV